MFVKKIKPDQLSSTVKSSGKPVVVKFYDTNCPLCSGLAEPFERLSRQYMGSFKFIKININDDEKLCEKYLDGGIPTLQVFVKPETHILVEYPDEEDPISGYPYSYLDKWLHHFEISYETLKNRFNNE